MISDSEPRPSFRPSRFHEVLSFMLGFSLVFSAPVGEGLFANWLVPLVGSYSLTIFDALVLPVSLITLCLYGFAVKPQERFLYASLSLVILSRLVSLVAAGHMEIEQSVSVFRYVEGMVVIYVCSIFLLAEVNRVRFVAGVLCGVALETLGGIVMFAMSGGQARGIFISVNSFMLQVFVIVLGILAIRARHQVLLTTVAILIVFVGLLATLTRSALLLLAVCVVLLFMADRRGFIRPLLVFGAALIIAGTVFRSGALVSELTAAVTSRNEDALARQGSVLHRLYLWDLALGTFVDHPVFGIGSGGFARLEAGSPQFFNVELSADYLGEEYHLSTHNNLLGVASETGLFGLLAGLLFTLAVFKMCLATNLKRAMFESPLVASAAIVTMALLLSDIWAAGSFTPISNTFIGFLAGWSRERAVQTV